MRRTSSTHEWLRRVADYHSGGVSDAERAAVEAHLATCQKCQEALTMYRRFYSLLRSPMRLGALSVQFDGETPTSVTGAPSGAPTQPTRPPQAPRRSRALSVVAALVAATLVVAGFVAIYSAHSEHPASVGTPTANATAASTAGATATPESTLTVQPAQFVCANPPGSNLTYTYVRGDDSTNIVTGCANPVRINVGLYSFPLAWSTAGRYLAIQTSVANKSFPLVIYDTSNGSLISTKFAAQAPLSARPGDVVRTFIGWLDNNTFLGAIQPVTLSSPSTPYGPSTIVKVDVATQAETRVGTIAWFAETKIIGPGYLFYGGLKTMSEGQAHLHRLDLSNGSDIQLVSLGEYGNGGCQGTPFCNWTAPWDVSPDGTHVLYHNPTPTSFPSDTNRVRDTPLVYAGIDGMNPSQPFGAITATYLTTPHFSPNGAYLVADGLSDPHHPTSDPAFAIQQYEQGGAAFNYLLGDYRTWNWNNSAVVYFDTASQQMVMYDLNSRSSTTLEPYSDHYLWAP